MLEAKNMNKPSRQQKAQFLTMLAVIIIIALLLSGTTIFSMVHRFQTKPRPDSYSQSIRSSQTTKAPDHSSSYHNLPTKEQATYAFMSAKNELKTDGTYNNHGAYVLNNNQSTLTVKNNMHEYAANTTDSKGRPGVANAFLTKHSRQYKNREQTNNGRTNWTPQGWHQMSNLPGTYKYAYNRGHLLGYALVGNIRGFDASESNHKNIIAQTMWANQANTANNTGQTYYEGLVRKALDHNKKVRYQVKPIYDANNVVPYGVQMQAKSTDNTLNFNVFVPNIQGNINIDYTDGSVNPNY